VLVEVVDVVVALGARCEGAVWRGSLGAATYRTTVIVRVGPATFVCDATAGRAGAVGVGCVLSGLGLTSLMSDVLAPATTTTPSAASRTARAARPPEGIRRVRIGLRLRPDRDVGLCRY
jgi:hypothetical protein